MTLSSFRIYFCGKISFKVIFISKNVVILDSMIVFSLERGRLICAMVRGVFRVSNSLSLILKLIFLFFLHTMPPQCFPGVVCVLGIACVLMLLKTFHDHVASSLLPVAGRDTISDSIWFLVTGLSERVSLLASELQRIKQVVLNFIRYRVIIANFPILIFHIMMIIVGIGQCNLELLKCCGDVELNPGPTGKLLVGSYNVSGCKNYSKLKRLMTWLFKLRKADRFIFSLQETHLSNNELPLIQSLWREGIVLAPSTGKARGVLTLFSNNLFENILFTSGTPDGRITVTIGNYDSKIDMFISLYSPNSGKNAEFYSSFFAKVNGLVLKYDVDNVYLSGDFNLVLSGAVSSNRSQSFYEKKLCNIITSELTSLHLEAISDITKPTWNRKDKFSTLDYIFGPKSVANGRTESKTLWALDKSDHAAILVTIEFDLDKGRGMLRPNLAFLESVDLRPVFEAELFVLLNQTNNDWDPHTKLEFAKMSIRSKVIEYSLKHRKQVDDKHAQIMSDIERAKGLKLSITLDINHSLHRFINIEQIDLELDKILAEKTKILSAKSRIKWLEHGEKSNKYFLNLNKSFHNSSYFKSFFVNGIEVYDSDSKIKTAFNFYANFYRNSVNDDRADFLDSLTFNQISPEDSASLIKPLTKDELTKVLKTCGDTACGPDGIGYKLLKTCWSFYPQLLIDSWNYGLLTGLLAPSHCESVICLLKKKGKDHRLISNLRPITLSNCDIKLISKALTKRCNPVLNSILDPHQTAYLPGRIVHDNLRLIDIIKDECNSKNVDGFLVSLDAKKAFDSVDHVFIKAVLTRFNFPLGFIKIFELLYNKIHSRVIINGYLTDPIPILRSVKQGDALSCVLFILCMETVNKTIQNDANINPIKLDGLAMPKVLAYADDIAVLAAERCGIYSCINAYSRFSKCSGLYLNVEKTEVLALNAINCSVTLPGINGETTIECVKKLTICGRTFSLDKETEYDANVTSKINNMIKALASWNKRSLSIFGRNLLLKTFGMSQLIYAMQNTHFDSKSLKKIESISYNFLWNKKADKTKAYERISRVNLKQSIPLGGVSAPDIFSIAKALMIKQLIRSTSSMNRHALNFVQTDLVGFNSSALFQNKCKMPTNIFVREAILALEELGTTIFTGILNSNDDAKLSKDYYDLVASENLCCVVKKLSSNPIVMIQTKQVSKALGIVTVGQLINEYKFPSTDKFANHTRNIISECSPLFELLVKRKNLTYGISYRQNFFLTTNVPISELQFTTKLIRQCLFKNQVRPIDKGLTKLFTNVKKIVHPKEREIAYFRLPDVILSLTYYFYD